MWCCEIKAIAQIVALLLMFYFTTVDYTPQVIYWVYAHLLRIRYLGLRSYLAKINMRKSFYLQFWCGWCICCWLWDARKFSSRAFRLWERQERRFHYCWHEELLFSERLCLEKSWNGGIPSGLLNIPSIALLPPSFVQITLLSVTFQTYQAIEGAPPPLPSTRTEQWVQTIRDFENHFL